MVRSETAVVDGGDSSVLIEDWKKAELDPAYVVDPEFRPKKFFNPDENIPVIDFSPFLSIYQNADLGDNPRAKIAELVTKAMEDDNNVALKEVITQVQHACENWGFFQITNHGVPLSVVQNLRKTCREFVDLPLAEKRKIKRSIENFLGFYDAELTAYKRDWKEVVDIACNESIKLPMEQIGENVSDEYVRHYNQWPENPADFREICEVYVKAVDDLASNVLGVISLSLGLEFSRFYQPFEDNTSFIRMNYYPKCPIPDRTFGASQHTDAGVLTVLVQDEVGGLQVRRKDGEWISVSPREDAFVINMGDMLQVWTNAKYHSIEHRVVLNENRDRFSFPLFYNPSTTAWIEPFKELVDEQHPKRYRGYYWGLFHKNRNDGNFKILPVEARVKIQNFAL
ncbi:unnamed protein product [Calypogeia fissa]